MTRAEQEAKKAYPDKIKVLNEDGTITTLEDSILAESSRRLFIKGYRQGAQDMESYLESWVEEKLKERGGLEGLSPLSKAGEVFLLGELLGMIYKFMNDEQ